MFSGAPQHPVALALQPVVAAYRLPQEHFQTVIDGMAMDLERNRYLDFADLERYCHCVAGVVGLMSAEIFGYVNPATLQYARDLGIAFQLTNIIRDVGEDARRGRVYLPQDELARHGVTATSLIKREMTPEHAAADGRAGGARTALARRARSMRFRPRIAGRNAPDSSWPPSTAPCSTRSSGTAIAVLDHRIALTPLRKLWIAWKTARRG